MQFLSYVLSHAFHKSVLEYLASLHPIDGHLLHGRRGLRSANFGPRSGDILEPPRRICVVREVRQPPSHGRSEEHTSELQSLTNLVCRLLLEKKKYIML